MLSVLEEEGSVRDGAGFKNATGIGPILAETTVNFKYPLVFPETVLVGCTILPKERQRGKLAIVGDGGSLTQTYAVWGLGVQRTATEGRGLLVPFDYATNRRATAFPDSILDAFAAVSEKDSSHLLPAIAEEFNL